MDETQVTMLIVIFVVFMVIGFVNTWQKRKRG